MKNKNSINNAKTELFQDISLIDDKEKLTKCLE